MCRTSIYRDMGYRTCLSLVCIFALAGCYGLADYIQAEGGGPRPVDPEALRVDSKQFPSFVAPREFRPPPAVIRPQPVAIKTTDVWEVRYKVGRYFLLHSPSYDERMCEHAMNLHSSNAHRGLWSRKCESSYLYTISVDNDGRVISPGWQLVDNPKRVVFSSNRRTVLRLQPETPVEWRDVSSFTIAK